ncbi:DNA repair protein RecN [Youngiibacter fragilis]|uniref:DNA repair protein RecN n=1 Tax=Youngiibacter fragilis 232.1 TaxID=994573 RepID=V7I1Z6_9CLOT|nr:DNA repair protein RecN [Youngiibacter fragilis]ETA79194.1 DNA repair protein RecN [Youngiibacter fragilis 232.1]
MLIQLNVRNFALIDSLDISFDTGYTILTGETGAGKSILIDSISFVLGGKFARDAIRTGADSAFVEAVFSVTEGVKPVLEATGIPFEDEIVVSRETFTSGKNTARVNGRTVLVGQLKEIGRELLDIHGQHNNQNLLDTARHLEYLDSYTGMDKEPGYIAYTERYNELVNLRARLSSMKGGKDRERLLDYLAYQIKDIEDARLSIDEEKDLDEKLLMLVNAEKLSTGLGGALELLDGEDGALDRCRLALKSLGSVAKIIEKAGGAHRGLEEAFYSMEEVARDLERLNQEIYFDADELEQVNQRLHTYENLKKKYGRDTGSVLSHLDESRKQLDEIVNQEAIIEEIKGSIAKTEDSLRELGKVITLKREEGGRLLSERINSEMKFIGLEKADFSVEVANEGNLTESGMDRVSFLISTNLGEPRKPLEKVVSGGELSRIMLAMKVAFIAKDRTPSVIFDEIDTGISGRVAEAVGEKMYSLSNGFQVFCVTHLPQIAAFSDNHFVVEKLEKDGRTITRVRSLDHEEKAMELAKMIGGSVISDITVSSARDIIGKSDELKRKYEK